MSVQKVDGKWLVRWRENGAQRGRRFSLKKDAEAWDREVQRRRQLGPLAVEQLTRRAMSLDEWVVARWTPEHAVTLEQSTRDRYAEVYQLHIQPALGALPVTELNVRSLRSWQAELVALGVGIGTIEKARTALSSVLSHAAESEEIAGNPLGLVRAPKAEYRDGVRPLPPVLVETIRAIIAGPMDSVVPRRLRNGRWVSGYVIPDERDELTRLRDATIVSLLAYLGERPGELRGHRWDDVLSNTMRIERATNPDGTFKPTKNRQRRSPRMTNLLYRDLETYYVACGQPPLDTLILPGADHEHGWTRSDWQVWRARRWGKACRLAGLSIVPKPYTLRHTRCSLLLAAGMLVHYVARQIGTSERHVLDTYGHLFEEYAGQPPIDAEAEVEAARAEVARRLEGRSETAAGGSGVHVLCTNEGRSHGNFDPGQRESPAFAGLSRSTATGIRTPVSAVRGRRPSPLDDSGRTCALRLSGARSKRVAKRCARPACGPSHWRRPRFGATATPSRVENVYLRCCSVRLWRNR